MKRQGCRGRSRLSLALRVRSGPEGLIEDLLTYALGLFIGLVSLKRKKEKNISPDDFLGMLRSGLPSRPISPASQDSSSLVRQTLLSAHPLLQSPLCQSIESPFSFFPPRSFFPSGCFPCHTSLWTLGAWRAVGTQ